MWIWQGKQLKNQYNGTARTGRFKRGWRKVWTVKVYWVWYFWFPFFVGLALALPESTFLGAVPIFWVFLGALHIFWHVPCEKCEVIVCWFWFAKKCSSCHWLIDFAIIFNNVHSYWPFPSRAFLKVVLK